MFGVVLLTSTLLALADARIYERCELVRDLLSLGIRKEHLATWVCIAFHESRFDTAARNPHSGDHGLLQISELYWCGAGKACGLPCSALRDDDISDDVECALRVHEEHTRLQGNGFLAWVVYPHHCKHNAKKYLADCESSVKTPSVRTEGRSRVLKTQNRNITNFSYNPKIDELLPPYLAIGSLFRGNYEKEFEQNYNNKVRVNWLNYKNDDIDNLKLPVFNQKVVGVYTSTTLTTTTTSSPSPLPTLTTTTTTSPSPLPKIKPPSPRRIESNSFRRRKMWPIFESVKFSETTVIPTTTTKTYLTTNTPITTYNISKIDFITRSNTIPQSSATTNIPLTTTAPNKLSTRNLEVYTSFAALPSTAAQEQTTKSPIVYRTSTEQTTITQERSTTYIGRSTPTISTLDQNSTKKSTSHDVSTPATRSRSFDVFKNTSVTSPNFNSNTRSTVTAANSPFNFGSRTSTTTSRPTTKSPWTWRTTPNYNTIIRSTTSKPSPIIWTTPKTLSSTLAVTKKNILTTQSRDQPTTSSPWKKSRIWSDSRPLPTAILTLSNNNRSSNRNLLLQTTTSKPRYTTPTVNSRSTTNPTTISPNTIKIVTSSELPSPTTARTTQSIFDLYLNPTKPPKIPAFSFPPFKSRAMSLRIFAGGTTTHTPTFSKSDRP